MNGNRLRTDQEVLEFAQDEEEFLGLLEHVKGARSVLEIGSRFGVSLMRLAKAAPDARIVSVDLPGADGVEGSRVSLEATVLALRFCERDVHLILGDSHDALTLAAVAALAPFDVCFIDGDHSYEGVWQDWTDYGPLASIVAFHDIAGNVGGVRRLWTDIERLYPTKSIITEGSNMGIGVVFR